MHERFFPPTLERASVREDEVVRILRERGFEDPLARTYLGRLAEQHEEEALKRSDAARANTECALKLARVYYLAGHVEVALQELESSRMEAWNRGDQSLYERIENIMDLIDAEADRRASEHPADVLEERIETEPKIEVTPGYEGFVPKEFLEDPFGYFENEGRNIKAGVAKYDEAGRLRDDPSAVKELPAWLGTDGSELATVAKKVNPEKGKVGESGDPFYEYHVLEQLREAGLLAARPVAKIEHEGSCLFVMEKISGMGWHERDALELRSRGYSDEEIESLKRHAETLMEETKARFEEAGVYRGWKLKDMVFDVDIDSKRIRAVTPTDWERTKIDTAKLEAYKNAKAGVSSKDSF
jgi:hypothetical protein